MTMSSVHLPKSLRSGVADEPCRYATDTVLLMPGKGTNEVLAVSTDGRQATVAYLEGKIEEPFQLPNDVLPKVKSGYTAEITQRNGDAATVLTRKIRDRAVVVDSVHQSTQQFPPVRDIMPEAGDDDIEVTLDAELLLKAARAMTTDPDEKPVLTLLISRRKNANKPIPLVGIDGFGVICPAPARHGNPGDRTATYRARRTDFRGE